MPIPMKVYRWRNCLTHILFVFNHVYNLDQTYSLDVYQVLLLTVYINTNHCLFQ